MAELARQHQGQDLAGGHPNAERGEDPVGTEADPESGEPPDPPTPSPPRTGDIQNPSENEDA
jgi:hypothetical protein